MKRLLVPALLLALLLAVLAGPVQAAPTLTPVSPQQGGTVRTGAPTLVVAWSDPAGIDPDSAVLVLDGLEYPAEDGGFTANATHAVLTVPSILALNEGNHTLGLSVTNLAGERAILTLVFVVNYTIPPVPKEPVDARLVVIAAAGGLMLLAGAGAGVYAWAHKHRRFTFRKHFLRHPGQVRFLTLYLPSGAAMLLTMGVLYVVAGLPAPPRFLTEQVLVAGAALAVGPFGLASFRATLRTRACERAFAQFLFELADAVRGGINPVKAVQELAGTAEGLLKKPLQQAADVLRLGRPMEEALRSMVARMDSPLVTRYAALVGEASGMGGSVAGVLQRAAKDMDDLVKIQAERRRSLRTPVFTMYMAFGVLLVMVIQIIGFAPSIGDLDMSALGAGDGEAQVAKMGLPLMQERFFHLLLVNALGAGLLVGSFTEGKVRNGLLHAIVMVGISAVAYPLFA